MSTRVDIDESAVLIAFNAAIRGGVTLPDGGSLDEKTCFLSFYSEPVKFPDLTFITVSPGAGIFPEQFQVGGGQHQCTEEMEIDVTIWNYHGPNQYGHDATKLVDAARGIFPLKNKILRAIVAADLQANYPLGTGGTQPFLRDLVLAVRTSKPEHVRTENGNSYVQLIITFKVVFDHDLLG